jgi:hypothetical protein
MALEIYCSCCCALVLWVFEDDIHYVLQSLTCKNSACMKSIQLFILLMGPIISFDAYIS